MIDLNAEQEKLERTIAGELAAGQYREWTPYRWEHATISGVSALLDTLHVPHVIQYASTGRPRITVLNGDLDHASSETEFTTMGRPRTENNRKFKIEIRLTEEEMQVLREKADAAHQTMSEYLRQTAIHQ